MTVHENKGASLCLDERNNKELAVLGASAGVKAANRRVPP